MKKSYTLNPIVLVILSLVLLLSSCAEPKAQEALLPDGLSSALVPDVPLDGYLYARQSEPIKIPGLFLGLTFDPSIQSLEMWIAPSGPEENIAAAVTFYTPRDAEAIAALVAGRADIWQMVDGNKIYLIRGTGSGTEDLKKVISGKKFVSLKETDKEAWNVLQHLPGAPASKPLSAGFVRLEERLINFAQKNSPGGQQDESVVSNLKLSKVKIAAIALYTTRTLGIADFLSLKSLKSAGAGIALVAKSSYPGFIISTALGQVAPRLNIEKREIDGKGAYYATRDGPAGEKVHVFFNNAGSYIYAQGAMDLARSQELYRWVWGGK